MDQRHGQGGGSRRFPGPLRALGALGFWSPSPAGEGSSSGDEACGWHVCGMCVVVHHPPCHPSSGDEEPSPAGLGTELPTHPALPSSEQQQISHGNTCVFYIFPPKRWVFKYSSSTVHSAKAARVYDGSLLLQALKEGCKHAGQAEVLPLKGVAPHTMCLLAPISTGRSQPQREGRAYPWE